jgi:hypothetical protein
VAPKENVSRISNLGDDVSEVVRRMDEYDQLLSLLKDEVVNKAGRADLQVRGLGVGVWGFPEVLQRNGGTLDHLSGQDGT